MDKKRRSGVIALLLVLSIGNFLRIEGHELVRPVLFLSVFAIGILSGMLLGDITHLYRNRKSDKDKLV
jgi:hypothetical protein